MVLGRGGPWQLAWPCHSEVDTVLTCFSRDSSCRGAGEGPRQGQSYRVLFPFNLASPCRGPGHRGRSSLPAAGRAGRWLLPRVRCANSSLLTLRVRVSKCFRWQAAGT